MKLFTCKRPPWHLFRGDKFRVLWKRAFTGGGKKSPRIEADGTTANCKVVKVITIDPNLSERRLLKVLVDEGIHACNFDLDNEVVDQYSDAISSFIWKVGYRLPRIPEDDQEE